MKNLFACFLLLFVFVSFSQVITINTTNTYDQLVNNVLINSTCVRGNNAVGSTGTSFGSNGIGSFTNTNPNFPMTSGVILSTGNVADAPGPNLVSPPQNSGNLTSWAGDSDLETALLAAGINMVSTNATYLKFDFTPISPNFSFDFIFASEEYGNFQCQFSDAFAFLLTNTVTGITTNLAVLPGTSTPISVETVRSGLYNSSCGSVNSNFFGNFYGGSNSGLSPTNFNGQTTLLNASAVLTPNVLYRVKLVIADRTDGKSDSAVFISGTSFNIGQDVLGPDLTVANGDAICFGENYTINTGLSATDYTFQWSRNNNVPVAGGPTFLVTSPGTYKVIYTKNGSTCSPEENTILVEYFPQIIPSSPINIYKCNNGSATYSFNIAINTPILLSGTPGLPSATTTITYFESRANANNNVSPIASPFASPGNVTIYARVANTLTGCYTVESFDLLLAPTNPVATPPNDLTECEIISGSNNASFIFNLQDSNILNGLSASAFDVLYYDTAVNQAAGTATGLLSANGSLHSSNTTIFVRLQNRTDPSCFAFTTFKVIVNPKLFINDLVKEQIVCTEYILPQLITPGVQYWTGQLGTGTQLNVGDAITNTLPFLDPQTIYLYLPGVCYDQKSFVVKVIDLDKFTPPSGTYCEGTYSLPSIDYASYYTGPGATGTNLAVGNVITTTQTIYVYYIALDAPFCVNERQFTVTIEPNPVLPTFANVFKCSGETYTLPALVQPPNVTVRYFSLAGGQGINFPADGTYVITASQTVYVFATQGSIPCTDEEFFDVYIGLTQPTTVNECTAYTLPQIPAGSNYFTGTNGSGTPLFKDDVIATSQTIYIYALTGGMPCTAVEVPLKIIITLPVIPATTPVIACGSYALPPFVNAPINTSVTSNQTYQPYFYSNSPTGFGTTYPVGFIFNSSQTIYVCVRDGSCFTRVPLQITINPNPIINTATDPDKCDKDPYIVPTIANVTFYDQPGGLGNIIPSGTAINTTRTIYAYGVLGGCIDQLTINITIFASVTAAYPINATSITRCNSFLLPAMTGGTRCFDTMNGPNVTGFTEYLAGHIFTTSQTVYFYNENPIRPPYICTDGNNPFVITINNAPVLTTIPDVENCDSYTLPPLQVITNTTVSYWTQTGGTGTQYFPAQVITSDLKLFVFAETVATPNCTDEEEFDIKINKVSTLPNETQCVSYSLPFNTNTTTPTAVIGDYYTGSGGTGLLIPKGTAITANFPPVNGTPSTKTVRRFYIYKNYPSTIAASGFCPSETFFDVTIISAPIANDIPLADRTFCDENDKLNDGLKLVDLSTLNAKILNPVVPPVNYVPQVGSEFTIAYYSSASDANANPPVNPISGSTDLKNIWVRVANTLSPDCYDVKPLQFFVNKIPETDPKDGILCADNVTSIISVPYLIKSELPLVGYTFEWKNQLGVTVGTSNDLSVIVPDTYTIVATDNTTGCKSVIKQATVSQSTKPIATYTLSENFSDNQFVTVNAVGFGGDYVYQLDEQPEQDSPVFENVSYGAHAIIVRDRNNCGQTPIDILVVNYPKYFTPNGDGFNDTWNIIGLEKSIAESTVYIFDRYGILITQTKPYESGWDGTFNGIVLPSTDYWFAVTYVENNIEKVFKSHFTLKR